MRTLSAFTVAVLCAVPASAAPFTWQVQGQITSVLDSAAFQYAGLFSIGQAYTLTLTMESTSPDTNASPGCGYYAPLQSATFASGSVALSRSLPGNDYVINPVGAGACDVPDNNLRLRSDFTGAAPGQTLAFDLHLLGTYLTDALVTNPSSITGGILDLYALRPVLGFPPAFAQGNVTSVTPVTVPEPASLLLFGLTGAGAWLRRRK